MRIRKATLALLAIFCLTCAFAQRKVTPVESSDELKIVTKEELKVLRQRAKSVQMLSDSVLQDSLRRDSIEKAAKQVKYPLLYSTSLGVNFWDPIAMALGQSYGEVEVWAALNLRNRFIPIVEVGMGTANSTPENGNYTYKNKLSLYGRVGMNYNFMFKSDPKYLLFGGLRFGASSFNYDITNISYTNGYWGNQTTFDILNQKGSLYVTRPSLQGYITTREELTEASNELFSLIASGVIKVDVAEQQKYPLKDAQRAHEILESRATQGSSLLIP